MKKISFLIFAILIASFFFGCSQKSQQPLDTQTQLLTQLSMQITSSAFKHNEKIPSQYTCDGDNKNPPLSIFEVPQDAKSLVLISDDPDAPMGTWVHWTLWNMDPKITEIAEDSVPQGAVEGTTSFGNTGYGGPCPPSGTHRYFFKLYALDTTLNLNTSAKTSDIEEAMKTHILAQAELIGLYSRK